MPIESVPLAKITVADLDRLVADGTSESQTVEYKLDWSLIDDARKKEFLADVASFANTVGGDIVYGVKAKDGVPKDVVGLEGFTADGEKLRAESLLAAWTKPRVAGVGFHVVPLASGRVAFVVRVPRSWSGPHMVTYNNVYRFVGRNSAGKFDLDVDQLRSSFLASSKAHDRIRDFRLERINRIALGDVGVTLATDYRQVLHVMPLAELASYSPDKMHFLIDKGLYPMGEIHSWGPSVNFEGFMVSATLGDRTTYSYVQLFRNGFIEAVLCSGGGPDGNIISPGYENNLRKGLGAYCQVLQKLALEPPYIVALSHVNAAGFVIYQPSWLAVMREQRALDRPHMLVPEKVLESSDEAARDAVLKQIFDQVWNAFGGHGSPNFDEHGKWALKPLR